MQALTRWIYQEDTYFLEVGQAMFSILWGGWLLAPWPTFGSTPTFTNMAAVAPEQVWGAVLVAIGVLQFWGLRRRKYNVRRNSLMGGFAVWATIAALIITANWRTTATITYPWVALQYAWTWLRVGFSSNA